MAERPRVRRFLRKAARAARRRVRDRAGPAARIAVHDRRAALVFTRLVGPLRQSLGAEEASWYGEIVAEAVDVEPQMGRMLASELPVRLARIPVAERADYAGAVQQALRRRPAATPLVVRTAGDLVATLPPAALEQFIEEGLALFDDSPARAESFLRRESQRSREQARSLVRGVGLDDVSRVLTLYAHAHCGEDLEIRPTSPGARGWVDERALHLPAHVAEYGDERDFLVYRVMTAHCAGYVEFGTFDLDLDSVPGEWADPEPGESDIARAVRSFPNSSLARDLLQVLEDRRVEARMRATYPGIARDIDRLRAEPSRPRPRLHEQSPTDQLVELLARRALGDDDVQGAAPDVLQAAVGLYATVDEMAAPEARVHDAVAALPVLYRGAASFLRRVEPADDAPPEGRGGASPPDASSDQPDQARPEVEPEPTAADAGTGDLDDDDYEGLVLPAGSGRLGPDELGREEIRDLARAIRDLEAGIDPSSPRSARRTSDAEDRATAERLLADAHPGGALVSDRDARRAARRGGAGPLEEGRGEIYPEWDTSIGDFKPSWTRVVERRVETGDPAFVDRVRAEHGVLIRRLRRSFEAMRPEVMRRRRFLVDGDEIDVEAAVDAVTVRRAGGELPERIYARRRPEERDVAAAFLIDLSSSTNEVVNPEGQRIIDVEKDALICIAEALDALGDPFAVWGFSGYGREQVDFLVAKTFAERLDDQARRRIGGLGWRMENRDGAAIRHATRRLQAQPARQRILFLLSDGRPLDCGCDQYFDRYAQEDTRAALREARQVGIHPFCITVDPHGASYLRDMYGAGAYTVVERVEALPARLPALYRRLTR